MGYWSDVDIAMGERENEAHLAPKLGISYVELCQLDYEIDSDGSVDGVIHKYFIKFNKNSPKSILEKIKGINKDLTVYMSPWEFNDNYEYEEEYEAIVENSNYLHDFVREIENINLLLEIKVDQESLKETLYRQLYSSIISTLETFLSSAFINLTVESDEYFQRFIKTNPEFKNQKFELHEIFDKYSSIQKIAQKVMLDTIYHNLPVVRNMFRDTFLIEFPDFSIIQKAVLTRHDLVHRNGFTKEGKKVIINNEKITDLAEEVQEFVFQLSSKLKID
jgi:hypothetical protein